MSLKELLKEHKLLFVPKDAYGHAAFLISSPTSTPKDFCDLMEKEFLLSNISDDRMLYIYQEKARLLISLFSMAKREKQLIDLFLTLYYQTLSELNLTRAKDGLERKMHGALSGYVPREALGGFGEDFFEPEEQAGQDLIAKLFKRRRKK